MLILGNLTRHPPSILIMQHNIKYYIFIIISCQIIRNLTLSTLSYTFGSRENTREADYSFQSVDFRLHSTD
ncbi:hypothetical protein L6452_29139 [Arctium lappa]|uniref:Uncharacterized protein n=1 Tax=Arctium lappa TaxID=4217 RepID=A0ACB8ZGR1_ARCLA|nr:hypothetical protein L6452_29139 [Arctium lappa]